jgi:hypothetical protein
MSSDKKGYLALHGADLIDAGYAIVPIRPGIKHPGFDGWQTSHADHDQLKTWLSDGFRKAGVGIITGNVIAVDIDVTDEAMSKQLEDWCHTNIGMAPVRVGQAPKRLLVYRADEPFTKVMSAFYRDGDGPKCRIEILGEGQQFVAFHVHPDTGKPYEWLYGESILDIPFDDLPVITREQAEAVAEEFENIAQEAGWTLAKKSKALTTRAASGREIDRDDAFAADASKTEISDEELHAKLLLVPDGDDYDTWFQVGMALHHQYDGEERGLELWHEWSALFDNYDSDVLDEKWPTFDISEKGRAPVTARLILKLSKEAVQVAATETADKLRTSLSEAAAIDEFEAVCLEIKRAPLSDVVRKQFVGLVQAAFKRIAGTALGVRDARDMVRFENPESKVTPKWLKGWVYLSDEDKFYNVRSRSMMTQNAFNSTFSRFMLTKQDVLEGRVFPDKLPAHVALNQLQVPAVAGRRYMPGQGELFSINGVKYANLYSERSVPEVPDVLSEADERNIAIVETHFEHLFADERERELFKDWLAYIVQNPGKRPNWAVLMQGTEGDGKTFFGMMMGAVLGEENLAIVDPKSLEENFNSFAEGHQVAFIEEVKLHGHNRYDVLNRIKPLITNVAVAIRRMRTDGYKVANMTSYLLATNYRDALPLTDNDSRYFMLFSRFQTKAAIREFKQANPKYYKRLYRSIEQSPGAIRGWLLNRDLGDEFEPDGRAPESHAHGYMVMMAKSDEQIGIEDVLTTSLRLDLSRQLLNATDLMDELMGLDLEIPQTSKVNRVLSDMGFTFLGRIRPGGRDSRPCRFWSQEPERFMINGKVDTDAIRNWVSDQL